jgi:hypothetical protein
MRRLSNSSPWIRRPRHRQGPRPHRLLPWLTGARIPRAPRTGAGQGPGADCLQRPLVPRSRFRQRLMPSVDMTSDVKGGKQLFLRPHHRFFLWSIERAGARKTRRLITLISVGWLPPSLHPSGACLNLGTSVPVSLVTLPRVTPNRGCVSSDRGWKPRKLVCQYTAIFMLSVRRPPASQWPT